VGGKLVAQKKEAKEVHGRLRTESKKKKEADPHLAGGGLSLLASGRGRQLFQRKGGDEGVVRAKKREKKMLVFVHMKRGKGEHERGDPGPFLTMADKEKTGKDVLLVIKEGEKKSSPKRGEKGDDDLSVGEKKGLRLTDSSFSNQGKRRGEKVYTGEGE